MNSRPMPTPINTYSQTLLIISLTCSFEYDILSLRVISGTSASTFSISLTYPSTYFSSLNFSIKVPPITAKIKWDEQTEIKKENYLRRERRASSMSRSFTLENVDSDRITAKHENGVLTLILPKKEPRSRGRRINIS